MAGGKLSTPLGRVRGVGSARSGTGDFWRQRLTAVGGFYSYCDVFAVV
jgi:succinate dehydrogenase / fumarate reductase membrane anchor subunit